MTLSEEPKVIDKPGPSYQIFIRHHYSDYLFFPRGKPLDTPLPKLIVLGIFLVTAEPFVTFFFVSMSKLWLFLLKKFVHGSPPSLSNCRLDSNCISESFGWPLFLSWYLLCVRLIALKRKCDGYLCFLIKWSFRSISFLKTLVQSCNRHLYKAAPLSICALKKASWCSSMCKHKKKLQGKSLTHSSQRNLCKIS